MSEVVAKRKACSVDARVIQVDHPCREHVRIEMVIGEFPESVPGQFVQVLARDTEEDAPRAAEWCEGKLPRPCMNDWSANSAYLRRPFSIADRWEDQAGRTHLVVISREVGVGTRWLDQRKEGDRINISGPLGRGFDLPDRETVCILVGGGVGIPPLLYLSRVLWQRGCDDGMVIFGVLSRDLFPLQLTAEPAADGAPSLSLSLPGPARLPAILTTNDGSLGMRGLVTDALRLCMSRRAADRRRVCVFACGPEGMLRAVARLTRELKLDCQLCIERMMGCGMGTCLSCVTRVHDDTRPQGWRWALACGEGPVFDRDRLVDD